MDVGNVPAGDIVADASETDPTYLIVYNDDTHTYQYVLVALNKALGLQSNVGFRIAHQVDRSGGAAIACRSETVAASAKAILDGLGPDALIPRSTGSMRTSVEKTPCGFAVLNKVGDSFQIDGEAIPPVIRIPLPPLNSAEFRILLFRAMFWPLVVMTLLALVFLYRWITH